MQIILEGPDNSGKSTLAAHLVRALELPLQHSGGPSKYPGEVNTRCFQFNQRSMTQLFDRHPAISQNIYVEGLQNGGELVTEENVNEFYEGKPLIIYCKNVLGVEGHRQSDHSSTSYFDQVSRNMDRICRLYDAWALEKAHMVYRIGDSMDDVVGWVFGHMDNHHKGRLAFDPLGDITEFHEHFGIAYNGKPRVLDHDLGEFRFKFGKEEWSEWYDASYNAHQALAAGIDEAELVHQLELQFDAMIDEMYVQLGTAYLQGFFPMFVEGWRRVHEANMKKVRAGDAAESLAATGRGHASDIIKPAGWTPPKHTDLLEDHAHRDEFPRGGRVSKDPIMRAIDLG